MLEALLSSGSTSGSLTLWDLSRGINVRSYRQAPPSRPHCLSLLGSHFVIMASNRKIVGVAKKIKATANSKTLAWSFESEGARVHNFVPHSLSAFVGSPDGKYVVGGSEKGTILIWHAPSGRLVATHAGFCQGITVMKLDPTGQFLAVGAADGVIHIFLLPLLLVSPQVTATAVFTTFAQHSLSIRDLSFSSTGRLYSVSTDQTCKVWDLPSRSLLLSVSFPSTLECLAVSPAEDTIYTGGNDGNIYKVPLFEVTSRDSDIMRHVVQGDYEKIFPGTEAITCLALNTDGSSLCSGHTDGAIKIWSTSNCQLMKTFLEHAGPVQNLQVVLLPTSIVLGSVVPKDTKQLPIIQPLSNIPYEKPSDTHTIPFRRMEHANTGSPLASSAEYRQLHADKMIAETLGKFQVSGEQDDVFTLNETLRRENSSLKDVNHQWKVLANELMAKTLVPDSSASPSAMQTETAI